MTLKCLFTRIVIRSENKRGVKADYKHFYAKLKLGLGLTLIEQISADIPRY